MCSLVRLAPFKTKAQVSIMYCIQPSPKRRRSSALLDDKKPDYFDKLPDDILIEILDRLPVEEAMGTTFLSKRWKDLWKWKWNIELGFGWIHKTDKKVLPSLFKIFDSLGMQDLRSICVSLRYYHSMRTRIQSLFMYASIKNVRELYIDFNDRNDCQVRWRRRFPLVPIPECELHPCLALIKLSLKSLELQTLPPSRFRALKELYLEFVKLNADAVESITSNCPLSLLCLCNCNPKTHLNIFVAESSNLRLLVIREEVLKVLKTTNLCIRAPNVRAIEFGVALPRRRYKMQGSLDCSEAMFRLNQELWSLLAMGAGKVGSCRKATENFFELLEKLRAVKVLTLSSWCIQVLTIEAMQLYRPLTFDVTHLILETGLIRSEFRGIGDMLLGCKKLEKLVVVMGPPAQLYFNMQCVWWVGHPVKFNNIAQELEVVEFRNLSNDNETWGGEVFDELQFFAGYKYGSLLLWNLKTYSQKLKKVVFKTRRGHFET